MTEILPLPKKSINDWPYGNIFDSPKDYFKKIFPIQLTSIRSEYKSANPKPQFVFCYGKTYWNRHREVFEPVTFSPAMNDAIRLGRNRHTVFILTNFFDYGRMGFSREFVDRLCELVLENSE